MKSSDEFDGIFLHRGSVDMRKAINGLVIIVEQEMQIDLFKKLLFVFCNRRADIVKTLYWDRTGFALWTKRLEKDKFKWPVALSGDVVKLKPEQLNWLLDGYDITQMKPHSRLNYSSVL